MFIAGPAFSADPASLQTEYLFGHSQSVGRRGSTAVQPVCGSARRLPAYVRATRSSCGHRSMRQEQISALHAWPRLSALAARRADGTVQAWPRQDCGASQARPRAARPRPDRGMARAWPRQGHMAQARPTQGRCAAQLVGGRVLRCRAHRRAMCEVVARRTLPLDPYPDAARVEVCVLSEPSAVRDADADQSAGASEARTGSPHWPWHEVAHTRPRIDLLISQGTPPGPMPMLKPAQPASRLWCASRVSFYRHHDAAPSHRGGEAPWRWRPQMCSRHTSTSERVMDSKAQRCRALFGVHSSGLQHAKSWM